MLTHLPVSETLQAVEIALENFVFKTKVNVSRVLPKDDTFIIELSSPNMHKINGEIQSLVVTSVFMCHVVHGYFANALDGTIQSVSYSPETHFAINFTPRHPVLPAAQ